MGSHHCVAPSPPRVLTVDEKLKTAVSRAEMDSSVPNYACAIGSL